MTQSKYALFAMLKQPSKVICAMKWDTSELRHPRAPKRNRM